MSDGTGNLILDFYERLPRSPGPFADLPELDDPLRSFFAAATARWQELPEYGGHRLTLLDLTGNPGTHTTKTYASLLIVARAVEHIRRTGRAVLIFTPTSGNKGVALRDAVLRALDAGLAPPSRLRVATLAPTTGRHKLRATRLSTDPELRSLNPQMSYRGKDPETVKSLAREYARIAHLPGTDIWFSLDLANYMPADAARAFFEHAVAPPDRPRIHAHAVSSAFGLLGYHAGRAALESAGEASPSTRAASLLVQHLAAPDMVLSLRGATAPPPYSFDTATGLYHQHEDPRFPASTYDPAEVLDPTFYTHRPVTSTAMNALITRFGGDGIVVSLAECIARYPRLRSSWLDLPPDLRTLHEWSTVMALTGVMNAVDRGLLTPEREIVVHGTGHYAEGMYTPLCTDALIPVTSPAEIAAVVQPA